MSRSAFRSNSATVAIPAPFLAQWPNQALWLRGESKAKRIACCGRGNIGGLWSALAPRPPLVQKRRFRALSASLVCWIFFVRGDIYLKSKKIAQVITTTAEIVRKAAEAFPMPILHGRQRLLWW